MRQIYKAGLVVIVPVIKTISWEFKISYMNLWCLSGKACGTLSTYKAWFERGYLAVENHSIRSNGFKALSPPKPARKKRLESSKKAIIQNFPTWLNDLWQTEHKLLRVSAASQRDDKKKYGTTNAASIHSLGPHYTGNEPLPDQVRTSRLQSREFTLRTS